MGTEIRCAGLVGRAGDFLLRPTLFLDPARPSGGAACEKVSTTLAGGVPTTPPLAGTALLQVRMGQSHCRRNDNSPPPNTLHSIACSFSISKCSMLKPDAQSRDDPRFVIPRAAARASSAVRPNRLNHPMPI